MHIEPAAPGVLVSVPLDHQNDVMLEAISLLFLGLGDLSRMKILRALSAAGAPINQKEIVTRTGLTLSNTSGHLTTLVRLGLLLRVREGNTVLFSMSSPVVAHICALATGHILERARVALQGMAEE